MPSFETLIAFLVTTAIFAFVPGPAIFYAAARTVAGGRWSGMMASLGIHVGGYMHVAAAAAGLSVLFQAVPWLYMGVKLAGAVYLIWLGMALFRSRSNSDDAPFEESKISSERVFRESVVIEVLNPKTALFFLAFLPQFVGTTDGTPLWLQFLVLGTLVNIIFSMADLICVLAADFVLAGLRRSTRVQRLLQKAGGTILVGLGIHMAFQRI